ncbi:hypothetical protein [Verminephrobacter eiseniae]|uniref:hypothetical protein n=1 Tax=Verminephrobacter eiseniae TaxID=364317 RepID=UPI002238DBB8|nr:hypothetical protein [Verminephrobacter eiseniae]
MSEPISGRSMQLWSTAPGVQVYAGHGLKADPARDRGRGAEAEGWLWQPGDGICLEPMAYPDKSALGKTAIDQNSETDGHADKKLAAEQVEGQAFCYMSPVGQPFLYGRHAV